MARRACLQAVNLRQETGRPATGGKTGVCRTYNKRNGQTHQGIAGGDREMRLALRLLRRECPEVPGDRAYHDRGVEELYNIRSAGYRARDHAVELPFLAGI